MYISTTIVKKRVREKKNIIKTWKRPWLWRAGPKQVWGLGVVGPMLRTHRAGKGPRGCGGWGLGSRNRRGPGVPPHPWSHRAEDLTWERSRLSGLEWAEQSPSSLLLLLQSGRGPPTCLSWSPWPPSCAPKDPCALKGALEGRELAWELSRLPRPEWVGQSPSTPLPLFPESISCLPLLICLASGVPILCCLHFSFFLSPSTSYQFTLGFLPAPWASESPTSGRQVPLLWGDANFTSSHTAILTLPPFITIIFNSLSGKPLISISLRSFSEVLSCFFNWNIFLSFFIFLDSLCWFVCNR